ncbi:hypothetical protein OG302_38860 [Streptomyces sp. NBC_01283]|uniref:hypothetical protein n=1 Tax=Streptomyces sp. NBC_01283 TaxID=2903812 RepID=UPI00352EF016|nr:hypothetical protein OG302_38860 [Streptomyces sp. NBC_01283]
MRADAAARTGTLAVAGELYGTTSTEDKAGRARLGRRERRCPLRQGGARRQDLRERRGPRPSGRQRLGDLQVDLEVADGTVDPLKRTSSSDPTDKVKVTCTVNASSEPPTASGS